MGMQVVGVSIFNENTKNGGSVTNGIFNGNSINTGSVNTGVFQGNSKNQGTANTAYVGPGATNEGTINNILSSNDVNKITYPTGEYVWIDVPPPYDTVLWWGQDYLKAHTDNNQYTLPYGSFVPIYEIGDEYWGHGLD